MTLLLRDRCLGGDVKAVRGQREVRNREEGGEREQRLGADPKDAGKDRQGQKNQAEKESQGQKIKKGRERSRKQQGWGTANPFPSPAAVAWLGLPPPPPPARRPTLPSRVGCGSVSPPAPLTTTPPRLSGSFWSPATAKGWNLSPSDASCLSSTAGQTSLVSEPPTGVGNRASVNGL